MLHVSVSTLLYSVLSMTCSIFTRPHFASAFASMGTVCELHEELSASDDDEEGPNTWDVFLDLITNSDFGARIQSSLADEGSSWTKLPLCDGLFVCGDVHVLGVA